MFKEQADNFFVARMASFMKSRVSSGFFFICININGTGPFQLKHEFNNAKVSLITCIA
eukprot:04613.XXX_945_1118_1 [CDS] Oithona nana genome sequencing.